MNISRENIDQLNAIISITLTPEDYNDKVEKALKGLKSKINVPGFRPGMVPSGMVKKMYGKAVLSDEVGKITVDELFKYLDENKIHYLGQPLPSLTKTSEIDWDTDKDFVFHYDVGMAPEFNVAIPTTAFNTYDIEVNDTVLETEIAKLKERNGRNINADVVEEKDFVMGEAIELDENNQPKEGGLSKTIYVFSDRIEDESAKAQIVGAKIDDVLTLNVKKLYKDASTAAIYLGIKTEEMDNYGDSFSFKINTINRMVPAEMNQEFFDKIFGEGTVTDEEQFRTRVKDFLKNDLQVDSNVKLLTEIREAIINNNQIDLPDDFLKRWFTVANEDKNADTISNILDNYESQKNFIRWEIIRNKLVEQYDVKVDFTEVQDAARVEVINRLAGMGYNLGEDQITDLSKRILSDKKQYEQLYMNILESKTLKAVRENITVAESKIDYTEYLEKMKNTSEPEVA